MPTRFTEEETLSFSIAFRDEPTGRASAAGISGINGDHRNTRYRGFVCDKIPKLSKSPFPKSFSLSMSDRLPSVKPSQIFKGNRTGGAFSDRYDLLTDNVVHIFLKSCFTARVFLKMPLCRFTTTLLKRCFNLGISDATIINYFTGEGFAIAGGGDIHNTKINAQCSFWDNWSFIGDIYNDTQVKLSGFIDKIDLALHSLFLKRNIVTKDNRDFTPSVNGADADKRKIREIDKPLIINNGRILFESMLDFLVYSIRVSDFCHRPDDKLRTQRGKFSTDFSIKSVMQLKSIKHPFLESVARNIIAGSIESLECAVKRLCLFFGRKKFHFQSQIHGCSIITILSNVKRKNAEATRLKAKVSASLLRRETRQ